MSKLYIDNATPGPSKSKTSCSILSFPFSDSHLTVILPLPGTLKSVALYWSPKACLPTITLSVQWGTNLGTFLQIIGSLKIVPPTMFLIVPLGDRHIFFRLNSFTLASSGVIVAHLTPAPYFWIALAQSTVTWSLVLSLCSIPKSKYFKSISR